jgi:hypothetical protein
VGLVTIAHEGEGEFAFGIILSSQEFHPEDLGVETKGFLEISHSEHGV